MTTYYNRFLARYDTLPVIYTSSRLKWYITYLGFQRHGFDVGRLKKSKYQFKLCAFSTFASSKFAHAQHCSNYKMWNDNSADGQNEAQGTKKCIHCNIIQMFLTGCLCHDYRGIHVIHITKLVLSKYARMFAWWFLVQNKYKNTIVGVLRTQITFVTHSSPSCYVTLRTPGARFTKVRTNDFCSTKSLSLC